MSNVRVTYTVRPDFADTNKANIKAVMDALQAVGNPGIRYSAYVLPDGVTFMHVAMFANEETRGVLGKLPEFGAFQAALKGSGLVSPPDPKPLEFVGASWDVFGG